ncbi:MAG: MATE family efflux transporter [Oscillospiraceae bacterium]|nr:MATE family efflux transporter [Oscillospiraceae bacterium]
MLRINRGREFYKPLISLALPLVLQNMINSSLSLIDTFMVGGLGEVELAAVTLGNNVFFLLMLITFGIQSGTSILISQYWGRKDTNTINRVMGLGLMTSGLISAVFVTFVLAAPRVVMSLMTPDTALIDTGVQYITVVAPAFILNSLSMVYLSVQRSMENARIGLTVLLISTAANTFMNYLLIYGKLGFPHMGVRGAATATVLARILELVIIIAYASLKADFKLRPKYILKPGRIIFRDFIKYSVPVIVNEALWGFGFMLYPIIVGNMRAAAAAVAAYSIAMSVDRILSAGFFGSGSAAAVLIGKRLGEGQTGDDAYYYAKDMLKVVGMVATFMAVLMAALATFVFRPFIFPLFRNISEGTITTAWLLILIGSANMISRALNYTIICGVLRGGGDVRAAAAIDVGMLYLIGLPLAFIFGLLLNMGVYMVFGAIFIEEIIKCAACIWRFRSRKWIKNVTREMA